jgi:hypothetical protein
MRPSFRVRRNTFQTDGHADMTQKRDNPSESEPVPADAAETQQAQGLRHDIERLIERSGSLNDLSNDIKAHIQQCQDQIDEIETERREHQQRRPGDGAH